MQRVNRTMAAVFCLLLAVAYDAGHAQEIVTVDAKAKARLISNKRYAVTKYRKEGTKEDFLNSEMSYGLSNTYTAGDENIDE